MRKTISVLLIAGLLSSCTQMMTPAERRVDAGARCDLMGVKRGPAFATCVANTQKSTLAAAQAQRNAEIARGVGLALVAGVVVVAASNSRHWGGGTSEDYAWDEFQRPNVYGNQWACRSKTSGEFADSFHCDGKPINDFTWPGPA